MGDSRYRTQPLQLRRLRVTVHTRTIEMTLHLFIFMQTIAYSATGYKPVSSIKSLERIFLGGWGGGQGGNLELTKYGHVTNWYTVH